jgi:ParB family chromosome partitioning protein
MVIDGEDSATQLEIEIEENTQRKNLTSDELAEAYFRLDRLRNPSLFRRIWDAVRRFFARIFSRET